MIFNDYHCYQRPRNGGVSFSYFVLSAEMCGREEQNIFVDDINDNFNNLQKRFFHELIDTPSPNFSLQGPYGTGKTFLCLDRLACFCLPGRVVTYSANSGIAALLLAGGTTAHSSFIPAFQVQTESMCGKKK